MPAYSIGGADGWTLTDLFENIYLRTAGPDMYDQLATHEIPWTDQSVKDALAEMAKIVGDTDNIAGGTEGALQTDFPTSVTQVFADPPEAAQVIEGDFVAGEITDSTDAEPETGFNVFPFPTIGESGNVVVGGGDTVIMFKDSPAAQALVEYLATPEAAQIWAERGGFASLDKDLDPSVYPDAITQATAGALAEAEAFRFDLSDLQPAEFGGTVGQGLFKLFQDFVAEPGRHRRDHAADGGGGGAGLRQARRRMSGASITAEPPGQGGSAVARGRPVAQARDHARVPRAGGLLPRPLGHLPGDPHVRPQLLRRPGRQFDGFVWFDNYTRLFNDPNTVTAIKNNAIWVGVVPAVVTAIGLIFAVLTERVSWSVAFKTVVFMPMAISLFAAGRHLARGDVPAGSRAWAPSTPPIASVQDVFNPPGVLVDAQPATDNLTGSPQTGLHAAASRCRPGTWPGSGSRPSRRTRCRRAPFRQSSRRPLQGGIAGVVWRDFKPGGGTPGEVEQDELGLPGVTVELARGRRRQRSSSDDDLRQRRRSCSRTWGRASTRSRSAPQTFAAPLERRSRGSARSSSPSR